VHEWAMIAGAWSAAVAGAGVVAQPASSPLAFGVPGRPGGLPRRPVGRPPSHSLHASRLSAAAEGPPPFATGAAPAPPPAPPRPTPLCPVTAVDVLVSTLALVTAARLQGDTFLLCGRVADPAATLGRALLDLRLAHPAFGEPLHVFPPYSLALGTAPGSGLLGDRPSRTAKGNTGLQLLASGPALAFPSDAGADDCEIVIPADPSAPPEAALRCLLAGASAEVRRFVPQNESGALRLGRAAQLVTLALTRPCGASTHAPALSPCCTALCDVSYGTFAPSEPRRGPAYNVDHFKGSGESAGGAAAGGLHGHITRQRGGGFPQAGVAGPVSSTAASAAAALAGAAAGPAALPKDAPMVPLVGAEHAGMDAERNPYAARALAAMCLPSGGPAGRGIVVSVTQRLSYATLGAIAGRCKPVAAYLTAGAPFTRERDAGEEAGDASSLVSTLARFGRHAAGGCRLVGAVEHVRRLMTATLEPVIPAPPGARLRLLPIPGARLFQPPTPTHSALMLRALASGLPPSSFAHVALLEEGVCAEAARRRTAALIVEAAARGLYPLAAILAGWVHPACLPHDGPPIAQATGRAQREGRAVANPSWVPLPAWPFPFPVLDRGCGARGGRYAVDARAIDLGVPLHPAPAARALASWSTRLLEGEGGGQAAPQPAGSEWAALQRAAAWSAPLAPGVTSKGEGGEPAPSAAADGVRAAQNSAAGRAAQVLLFAGLQGYVVEGALRTPMGQRLTSPLAVLNFLALHAQQL